jgi:hypothetical protein
MKFKNNGTFFEKNTLSEFNMFLCFFYVVPLFLELKEIM